MSITDRNASEGEAEEEKGDEPMKKNIVRGVLTAVLFVSFTVGLLTVLAPVTSAAHDSCEAQCNRDYRRRVPICAKNPCFVSCETVLQICLSNCGSES